jgi:hypothetical protein
LWENHTPLKRPRFNGKAFTPQVQSPLRLINGRHKTRGFIQFGDKKKSALPLCGAAGKMEMPVGMRSVFGGFMSNLHFIFVERSIGILGSTVVTFSLIFALLQLGDIIQQQAKK